MHDFLIYDAKVAVLIIVFYMFYRLMLSRETFHRVNRVVLLLTAVSSFVLPLCVITFHKTVILEAVPTVSVGNLQMESVADTGPELWQMVLPLIFIIGVVATLGHTLASILKVWLLIRRSEKHPQVDGTVLCVTGNAKVSPFSWMQYIVMNRADYEANEAAVLAHERGHIRLRHSWDLLLVDLLTSLQWFNPAMWMLRQDLRAIHEYEADGEVLSQGINARQYQYLLISKASGIGGYSIANGISHSTLKNRITMMLHKKSNRRSLLKLLALVPIVGMALALNARTVTDYVYDEPQKQVLVKKGKKNAIVKTPSGNVLQIIASDEANDVDSLVYDVETFDIKGIVVDREDNSPIVGAIVKVAGSTKGTVTDREGAFRMEVAVGDRIEVMYAGYETFAFGASKAYAKDRDYTIALYKEGTDHSMVFDAVEVMPQYPGGPQALFEFLSKTIRYPVEAHKAGIEGRVLATFVVKKDGSISDAQVVKSVDPQLDAEAIRVINAMPNWEPGRQNGKPVNVKYTVPITFRLDGKEIPQAKGTAVPSETPLVIVDGEAIDFEMMKGIDPKTIEKMDVLKGKAATDTYGEKAKNGVIVITTKKK